MKIKVAIVLIGMGLFLAARPIVAHHSFSAEFDSTKPISVTGAVTKFEWTNPHAWIYIDLKDETGKVSNWGFELGGVSGLLRNGWTRNSLKAGDVVTIEGSKARNGTNHAAADTIIMANTGKKLFSGQNQQN